MRIAGVVLVVGLAVSLAACGSKKKSGGDTGGSAKGAGVPFQFTRSERSGPNLRVFFKTVPGTIVQYSSGSEPFTLDANGEGSAELSYEPKVYLRVWENGGWSMKEYAPPLELDTSGNSLSLVPGGGGVGVSPMGPDFTFNLPEGSKVTIGGVEAVADATSMEKGQHIILDDKQMGSRMTVAELASQGVVAIPVSFTLPDGTNYKGSINTSAGTAWLTLIKRLGDGAKTGTKLDPDSPAPAKPRAVVVTDSNGRLLGSAKTIDEIDLVAVVESAGMREGTCGLFRAENNMKIELKKRMRDAHVTVYERRTGKVVGSRDIKARDPKCPKSITADMSQDAPSIESDASGDEVDAWVKTLL